MNIEELEMKLKVLDEEITNYSVNKKSKKISKHIEEISDPSNKFDNNKMWKLRKKLCPKVLEIPSAKLNEKGILITEKSQLKNLYKKTYIDRLSHREMLPGYENLFSLKNYLFELRMIVTSKVKSLDWTAEQLMKVLKSLKNNKS